MTTLREAAQQALEALEYEADRNNDDAYRKERDALRAALAEPVQEPVAHSVIAGALFDIMGWLTSRRERIVLSSADNASPAVEAITEFAKMRGLSLDDAKVQDWNTAPPQRKPPATIDEIFDRMNKAPKGVFYGHDPMTIWMEAWRAAEQHGIKNA